MNKLFLSTLLALFSTVSLNSYAVELPKLGDFGQQQEDADNPLTPRYKVNEIEVRGTENRKEIVLLAFMIKPGQVVTEQKIRQEIQNVYNLGYFKDDINFNLQKLGDGVKVIINVSDNPIVKDIKVIGNTVIAESEIRNNLNSYMGKTLNLKDFKKSLEEIRDVYVRKGYNGVLLDPQITQDGYITLKVTEGIIENIVIKGNKDTKDYVIRRELRQKSGDIYNSDIFEEDKRRLINTNIFDTVDIKYLPGIKNKENIIISVEVKEKEFTGEFLPGISYSVRDGITGSLVLRKENLFGTGQNIALNAAAGGGWFASNSGFNFLGRVDWNEPWFLPELLGPKTGFGVSLYRQRENNLFHTVGAFKGNVDNISSNYAYPLNNDRTGLSLGVSKALFGDPVSSPFRIFFNARAESLAPIIPSIYDTSITQNNNIKTYNDLLQTNKESAEALKQQFDNYVDSNIRKGLTLSQKGYDNRLATGITLSYDTRDYFMNPRDGWYHSILLEPSFGDISYFKLFGNFNRYIPVPLPFTDKVSLAFNAQIGTLSAEKVSLYERFYSSGNYAIRGWPENGYFNGERMFLGSAELRFPIYDFLSGALFLDAGNFWDQNWKVTDYNVNDQKTNGILNNQSLINQFLRLGYGFGVRVNTPLGMIRLDYGIRDLSRPFDFTNGAQLHFNMGQKF